MKQTSTSLVSRRTKHIDIRYWFVRQVLEQQQIDILPIDTKNQHADVLTKALTPLPFKNLVFDTNYLV